jgi:hypothetical protein
MKLSVQLAGHCIQQILHLNLGQVTGYPHRFRMDFTLFSSWLMRAPCCVCELPRPIHFWMPEPIFMKLGMYIIATVYFVNPSHQSMCLYVYHPVVAKQRLGKNVTAVINKGNNRIIGRVIFCAIRVLSKESRRLVLHRTCYLQENYSAESDGRIWGDP